MGILNTAKEPILDIAGVQIPFYAVPLLVFALIFILWSLFPGPTYTGILLAGHLWPLWVPPLLLVITWGTWVKFRQAKFFAGQEKVLFELKIPREMQKSPLAMEAVLSGLHRKAGEGNLWDLYMLGKFRAAYSLELVSFEGQIRFFVWGRRSAQNSIETSFYGQYPEIQIVEVDDYALRFPVDLEKYKVWGMDYKLTKDDVYPIKTYVDYGLDKDPKEEYKVDPFANVLEFLGSMGKGEQVWIQMVIQFTTKEWREEGEKEIKKIREDARAEVEEGKGAVQFTENEKRAMDAIDRNTAKLAFDTGIRGLYIAEDGKFDGTKIPGLIAVFKQFSSENLNGFKPKGGMVQFNDFPWESERAKNEVRKDLLMKYKRRGFFRAPDVATTFALSTEELATIFRIPSRVIEVPTLPRINSATGEPPANLPT